MNKIKTFFVTVLQLLLIAFLSFIARECWKASGEEKLSALFAKEATLVQVRVHTMNTEKKIWQDYIGNSKYIGFEFHGKDYNLRILQDSGWVGEGSNIWLQYHPGLDQFRQPGILYHDVPNRQASKLIRWTILSIASPAHRMLFFAVGLTFIVILMVCSLLERFTGWWFFSRLSRVLVTVFFVGGGLFMSWNTWADFRYYRQLKNGTALVLPVLQKDKITEYHHSSDHFPFYYYTATVAYPREPRDIMISSEDYDRLSVGDSLPVLYNAVLDDMVAADYTPGYAKIAFVVMLWMVIGYIVIKQNCKNSP